jgi:hypothetical protein
VTPQVVLTKLGQKLAAYGERVARVLTALPKKLLAKPLVLLCGRFLCSQLPDANRVARVKPHILILRNKYYAKNSGQVSTEQMHLDHTLKASGLATFDVLTFDHDLHLSPFSDLKFMRTCGAIQPDAIVFSSWWDADRQPSAHAIEFVRKQLGIRLGVIWWDTCSQQFWTDVQRYTDLFDVHVVLDNPKLYNLKGNESFARKILQLWAPQDESLYFPRGGQDIPVLFMGQVSAYRSYRSEAINYLVERGIPGKFLTNDRNQQVTHAEYAEQMGRSAIAINFSYSVNCHQLKSRVFEILFSGALLLESENEQTASVFEPLLDYVPFASKEDLEAKVLYYLNNTEERDTIARRGRESALKKYRSNIFWGKFLGNLIEPSAC